MGRKESNQTKYVIGAVDGSHLPIKAETVFTCLLQQKEISFLSVARCVRR